MIKGLLIAAITLLPSTSYASCEDVNLYNIPDSPFREMPIYDQDGDGLCYAYSASQLVDFYRISESKKKGLKTPPLTSAYWVAYAHKTRNRSVNWKLFKPTRLASSFHGDELGYADIGLALKDLEQMGSCDPELINKKINALKNNNLNEDEFLYLAGVFSGKAKKTDLARIRLDMEIEYEKRHGEPMSQELWEYEKEKILRKAFHDSMKEFKEQRLHDWNLMDEASKNSEIERLDPYTCKSYQAPLSSQASELFNLLKENFDFETESRQLNILKKTVFSDCLKQENLTKIALPKVKHTGKGFEKDEDMIEAIDQALGGQNPAPAAIGFCSKSLKEKNFDPPLTLSGQILPRTAYAGLRYKKCGAHYSMIVGRRKKDNECQYMIRNTYGSSFWNPHMECTCEQKTDNGQLIQRDCTYEKDGKIKDLTVLGCWIPGKNLSQSVYSVSAFEK